MLVDYDRLIDIHDTYGWVIDGFEPSGHVHGLAYLLGISTGTGYPGNDGGLQAVDRVGADSQQARTMWIYSDSSAGPVEHILRVVHPRTRSRAPPAMGSR